MPTCRSPAGYDGVKGLDELRTLRVDDNRLTWIDVDTFQSTPLLAELGLAENQLSAMAAETLAPLTQLSQLALDANQLEVKTRKTALDLASCYS